MNTIFLLIFLPPLGLALRLIVRGIRGFRVGDHPVCRRCGFDLFGSPTKAAVCGECGADLRRRKAVCVGHHRLRRTQLGTGSFLLIVILGVAGGVGYGQAMHVNWWNYAPLWCLLRAASSAYGSWRRPAVAELTSRYNSHTFSATEMDRITMTGLAYQRDVSKPWDFAWGDLIEKAHTDGKLSAAEWQQYLSQALDGISAFNRGSRFGAEIRFHIALRRLSPARRRIICR